MFACVHLCLYMYSRVESGFNIADFVVQGMGHAHRLLLVHGSNFGQIALLRPYVCFVLFTRAVLLRYFVFVCVLSLG